jgi:transcriptional regulator with XRE-family HTH domain
VDDANGVPHEETEPAARARKRAEPEPPRTIGEALARAREAAGLSLAQVAERTKVRPGILTEIEADAHDRLPALTYSIGFVKAYARTVGMDPDEAARRYRLESQKGDPVPTMVDLQPLEEKRLPSPALVTVTVALLVLLLGGFWAWGAGWLTPAAPPPPAPPSAEAAAEAEPDGTGAEPAPPAAPDAAAPVTLTAREEVWVRIADGSETLFTGTLAKGQTMALPPGRAWQLRTGRAGALEVKVGATAIPPLGGPAEQVRGLSLAPADLLARPRPETGGLAPATPVPGLAPAVPSGGPAPVVPSGGPAPAGASAPAG